MASCSPPQPRAASWDHWWAQSQGAAAARGTCGLLWTLCGASASGCLQALASGEKNKTVPQQVQASGVKAPCGIKDETPPLLHRHD